MVMSKRCIPYTPRSRELKETTFALITTAGVHQRDQQPFNVDGDNSWRVIAGDSKHDQLMVTHDHYEHRDADRDINCVFPIDRLHDLVDMGIIGAVAPMHFGFMGFIPDGRLLRDTTAPIVAERLRDQGTDAVVLTPG